MGLAWYQMLESLAGEIRVAMAKLRLSDPDATIHLQNERLIVEAGDRVYKFELGIKEDEKT